MRLPWALLLMQTELSPVGTWQAAADGLTFVAHEACQKALELQLEQS